jgi:CubicO group peptidase (beta-lactamase class C family)
MKTNHLASASISRALRLRFLILWAMIFAAGRAETPFAVSGASASAAMGESKGVAPLDVILQKYPAPAIGGAIVDSSGVKLISIAGVRKKGETAAVTIEDVWHLGSCTKAITATMIAALVEQKKLSWDSNLAGVFPELGFSGQTGRITLLQLLSHRAGLPTNTDWGALSKRGSLVEQRRAAVAELKTLKLMSSPGSTYSYSNWGYVVVGAMAEQVTGKSYEELMQTIIFGPLQMKSAGFGAGGTPGSLDAPWGHGPDGKPSQYDNPLVVATGGGIHCSLEDWGKFISDQLRGAEGKPALLKPESYARLHSAPSGGTYALGWMISNPSWGGGDVLEHGGSNAFNLAFVSVAPARDIAVLTVCNAVSPEAFKAREEVGRQLMAWASIPNWSPGTGGEVRSVSAHSDPTPIPASANGASEIKLDDAQSDPVLGDYTLGMGIVMKFSRESGTLFMQMVGPGRPPNKHELGATSATEFFAKDGPARFSFVKEANGKVTRVVLHQKNAPDQEFPKAQNSGQTTVGDNIKRNDAQPSPNPTSADGAAEIKLEDAQSDPILGDYTLPGGVVMKIGRESGNLFMQVVGPGQPAKKRELGATSDTEFFRKDAPVRLSFVKDSNGKAISVVLHQPNAPDQKFPKAQ